jgi:hypothetical protein
VAANPASFEQWCQHFKGKQVWRFKGEDKEALVSVATLLSNVMAIKLRWGTHGQLVANLLRACHCASLAPDPKNDSYAVERQKIRSDLATIREIRDLVGRILVHLPEHKRLVDVAFKIVPAEKRKAVYASSPVANDEAEDLIPLLHDLHAGLSAISDEQHRIHLKPAIFLCGPFDLDVDVDLHEADIGNINQTGLIFHLAFLFRLFTASKATGKSLQVDASGIVAVEGRPLDVGKPHYSLVASLVNATLPPAGMHLTPRSAMYRLRDLYRQTKGAKVKKRPVFIGWK